VLSALHARPGEPPRALSSREDLASAFREGTGCLWVDLQDPSDEEKGILGSVFGFHRLAVEQCLGQTNHPRLHDFGDYLSLVFHGVRGVLPLATEELDVFLGSRFIVTHHRAPIRVIEDVRKKCGEVKSVMERGPDRVLAEILDDLADGYLGVMERLNEGIDGLEDKLFKHAGRPALREIFTLKKEILHLRRIVGPQREVLHRLSRGEFKMVSPEDTVVFRDVFDRICRVSETLESFRDMLTSAMEVYLTVVSNRTNEVVKVLTVFSIVLMTVSLLAGIYGMNFEAIPLAKEPWGFWALLGIMAALTGGLLLFFKRRRWI
jgi:magnesium transporter